jgi:hypothetical protein
LLSALAGVKVKMQFDGLYTFRSVMVMLWISPGEHRTAGL